VGALFAFIYKTSDAIAAQSPHPINIFAPGVSSNKIMLISLKIEPHRRNGGGF
jgi:hypothetical protein